MGATPLFSGCGLVCHRHLLKGFSKAEEPFFLSEKIVVSNVMQGKRSYRTSAIFIPIMKLRFIVPTNTQLGTVHFHARSGASHFQTLS